MNTKIKNGIVCLALSSCLYAADTIDFTQESGSEDSLKSARQNAQSKGVYQPNIELGIGYINANFSINQNFGGGASTNKI